MGSAPSNRVFSNSNCSKENKNDKKSNEYITDDYAILDNEQPFEEISLNIKKLELSFKFIETLNSPSNILKNKKAFKSFIFMSKLSMMDEFRDSRLQYDLLTKHKLIINIFSDMYSYCFEDIRKFVATYEYLNDFNNKDEGEFQKLKIIYLFLNHLNHIIWLFTESSQIFRLDFHKAGATNTLVNLYLSDENFILNCLRFKLDISNKVDNLAPGLQTLRAIIGICHNLTKLIDNTKSDWLNLDACSKLIKFSNTIYKYPEIRVSAYMALANIMSENDVDKIDTLKVINDLVKMVKIGADSISNKTDLRRIKINLDFNENSITEAAIIIYRDSQYNIVELLETLNRIAVIDSLKYEMFKNYGMGSILKMIIIKGNYIEKEYATKLLWQLCFDSRIQNEVMSDDQLLDYLKNLNAAKEDNSVYKRITNNVLGIMWLGNNLIQENTILKSKFNLVKRINNVPEDNAKEISYKKYNIPFFSNDKKSNIWESLRFSQVTRKIDIESKSEEKFQNEKEEIEETKNMKQTSHIMISYNKESRELCLRIKKELENVGFTIWIDIQDIHGSSLESMARAIENSICVIICMTEKYKLSPNCRAEAEYSFNLRKPIVPLIMQKDYTPDGWLGIILGSKIFIDFTKYKFEECVKRLKNEINNLTNLSQSKSDVTLINSVPSITFNNSQKTTSEINNWNSDDVNKWLTNCHFNEKIIKNLQNFNGELIKQLYAIYKDAPEYYFQTLSQNNQIDLFSVVKFTNELNKLFL